MRSVDDDNSAIVMGNAGGSIGSCVRMYVFETGE